jgi:hypothetical protein
MLQRTADWCLGQSGAKREAIYLAAARPSQVRRSRCLGPEVRRYAPTVRLTRHTALDDRTPLPFVKVAFVQSHY